jgi:hypothetical protein
MAQRICSGKLWGTMDEREAIKAGNVEYRPPKQKDKRPDATVRYPTYPPPLPCFDSFGLWADLQVATAVVGNWFLQTLAFAATHLKS